MDTNQIEGEKLAYLERIALSLEEVARLLAIVADKIDHPPLIIQGGEVKPGKHRGA